MFNYVVREGKKIKIKSTPLFRKGFMKKLLSILILYFKYLIRYKILFNIIYI